MGGKKAGKTETRSLVRKSGPSTEGLVGDQLPASRAVMLFPRLQRLKTC